VSAGCQKRKSFLDTHAAANGRGGKTGAYVHAPCAPAFGRRASTIRKRRFSRCPLEDVRDAAKRVAASPHLARPLKGPFLAGALTRSGVENFSCINI